MKQVHPNYTFDASTKTITLTGLNIAQDQLLLITNATRGVVYYNFASSSHRAEVTAGANTTVVLTDASTTGHANNDQLVIHYEDQSSTQNIAGTVTVQTDLTTGGNEPCVVLGYSTPGGMTRVNYLSGLPIQAATPIPVSVQAGTTIPVSGTVTANPAGVQTISGTVTANLSSDVTLNGIDQNDLVANVLNGGGIPVYPRDNASLNGAFPISATSLPLPSGAATSANQTTANTSLSNIDTDIGATADSAASTDTGTFSLIGLFKRLLQRITTLLDRIPAALVSGRIPVDIASQSQISTYVVQPPSPSARINVSIADASGNNDYGTATGSPVHVQTDAAAVGGPCAVPGFDSPAGVLRVGATNGLPIRTAIDQNGNPLNLPVELNPADGSAVGVDGGGNDLAGVRLGFNTATEFSIVSDSNGLPIRIADPDHAITAQIENYASNYSTAFPVDIINQSGGLINVTDKGSNGQTTVGTFSSTTSAPLASYDATRKLLTIFNEGPGNLYVLYGSGTASTTNYSVRLAAGDYLEIEKYTGDVNAIFATAGTARVTGIT